MPFIQVSMAKGRTEEQKRTMLHAISKAVSDSIGAPETSIRVWIHEFDAAECIAGGEILADRRAREAAAAQAG